jgi:hypothetical protein
VIEYRGQCRALVNTVMNLRILSKAGNFLINWAVFSLSKRTLLHELRAVTVELLVSYCTGTLALPSDTFCGWHHMTSAQHRFM